MKKTIQPSTLTISPRKDVYCPLDEIKITAPLRGILSIRDGRAEAYFRNPFAGTLSVTLSGALGTQVIALHDKHGAVLASRAIRVDCETDVFDQQGTWHAFHQKLYWNLHKGARNNNEAEYVRYRGRTWFLLSCWLRDNVHILKGKKYYQAHLKDALDLYAENQAANGMIFDFFMDDMGPGAETRSRTGTASSSNACRSRTTWSTSLSRASTRPGRRQAIPCG